MDVHVGRVSIKKSYYLRKYPQTIGGGGVHPMSATKIDKKGEKHTECSET